jgi:hypothetical protein
MGSRELFQFLLGAYRVGDTYLDLFTDLATEVSADKFERPRYACVYHDEPAIVLELVQREMRYELAIYVGVQLYPVSTGHESARRWFVLHVIQSPKYAARRILGRRGTGYTRAHLYAITGTS